MKVDDVEDDEVKGEEDDDVEEEEDDDVEKDDVEVEDRSQDRTHTLCEPAQSKCTWTFHTSHLCGNLHVKCRGPAGAP